MKDYLCLLKSKLSILFDYFLSFCTPYFITPLSHSCLLQLLHFLLRFLTPLFHYSIFSLDFSLYFVTYFLTPFYSTFSFYFPLRSHSTLSLCISTFSFSLCFFSLLFLFTFSLHLLPPFSLYF